MTDQPQYIKIISDTHVCGDNYREKGYIEPYE